MPIEGLADVARAAFGTRELVSAERLRGGSKKGVYRLTLNDQTTSIAYVWNAAEDYWPAPAEQNHDDPLGHATGLNLFETAHATLSAIGVRVPQIIMLDRSKTLVAGDLAVVEDIRGDSLEALLKHDPHRAQQALAHLGEGVQAMHHTQRDQYGRPGSASLPVEHWILRRAEADLAQAAARVGEIAAVKHRLADLLAERHAAVTTRTEFGFIHSELDPDHVLVDDHDRPVLIDIEGAMFFDIEWEHVFLELRFADNYRYFRADDLDHNRMRFYRLATYLSLVAGPLRLLDGDFPHRAAMLDIVKQNIGRALAQLS